MYLTRVFLWIYPFYIHVDIQYFVANYKQLVSLDDECISILKEKKNKSAYIRELIKKNQIPKPKPKVVIRV